MLRRVTTFVHRKLTKLAYQHMFPVDEFNDVILEARIRQLQFLQPCHLDLEGTWDEHFVAKAVGALKQMQFCHRPLDKLRCVDDASRLVCNMIGYTDSDDGSPVFPGADEFFPPFLLLLIRTNPPHLTSTIEYCNLLLDDSWSAYPALEILLSHLEACKQFVLTCTCVASRHRTYIHGHASPCLSAQRFAFALGFLFMRACIAGWPHVFVGRKASPVTVNS